MNIYQISQNLKSILNQIEENEGELTPEIEQQLAISESDLQQKAIDYAYVIKNQKAEYEIIDLEIKRLTALKKAKENTIDRLKDTVKDAMIQFGIENIKTPLIKLSVRNYASVEAEQDFVDEKFITKKEVLSIDKKAIKAAIENGEHVDGARIIYTASLIIT